MPFNLLKERWIPVRRRSGAEGFIAPHQMVEADDPPIAIASPRPDFDGALIQFLIGLTQTTAAPEGRGEWEKRYANPFSPEELQHKFLSVEAAFNLDGDGPRFMQDLTLTSEEATEEQIGALLIDRMGAPLSEKGLFRHPSRALGLSLGAAAMALLTLQTNAPTGGRGHRTSLRGGGPLSTLLRGETLFRTVWLNVLVRSDFQRVGNTELSGIEFIFPWMAPTRLSDEKAGGAPTTPESIHPAQHFWGMPRRIRLQLVNGLCGACAIFGTEGVAVTSYLTRHSGMNYKGDFRHPLTPYSELKPGEPLNPKKAGSDGIPYRDWPTFMVGGEKRQPARVVQAFHTERRFRVAAEARLWAFGFEMDNMKARAWHQASTPVVAVDTEWQAVFREVLEGWVEASESVRQTLVRKVKEAIARRPEDLRGDLGASLNAAFWARTEAAFFETVLAKRDALVRGDEAPAIAEIWLTALHEAAKALFDAHSQLEGELSATDVHRVARAWNELLSWTSPHSSKLRAAVGLAAPESPKPKRSRRSKKEDTIES